MNACSGSLLLIDDEKLNRLVLSKWLERKGFTVVVAESGPQGLSLLEEQPFDLVLLDIMMPEMSGLQVLAQIRKGHRSIDLPVIMVTAMTESENVVEALTLGANDYVTKPVDFPVALARIETQLASKRSYQRSLGSGSGSQHKAPSIDRTENMRGRNDNRSPTLQEMFDALAEADGARVNIGGYEADSVIGQGAMGIVVKAYDPSLCRYVALKFLAPDLAKCSLSRQRFTLEGRFAAALRHENVVAIYGVNELEGIPYLVMEYISGRSLQQIIDAGEAFTVDEIVRIGRETALGLAAAHEMRLIHRDVKPSNILVENRKGGVRIADFGVARAIDQNSQISANGLLVGTPLYMSPEQVDGKPLTQSSDLFSLGSVLYTLCTGDAPFAADTISSILRGVALKPHTSIREVNHEIPEWLATVIDKLLAKNPEERFSSAAELAEELSSNAH